MFDYVDLWVRLFSFNQISQEQFNDFKILAKKLLVGTRTGVRNKEMTA